MQGSLQFAVNVHLPMKCRLKFAADLFNLCCFPKQRRKEYLIFAKPALVLEIKAFKDGHARLKFVADNLL